MQLPLSTDEKTQYREYWQHNAEASEKQECYSWMSAQLLPHCPAKYVESSGKGIGMTGLVTDNPAIVDNGDRTMQSIISIKP